MKALGVDAIWISPIVANTEGGFHGYWAENLNEINYNFGTVEDLINLVYECHRRGIYVMLDVVANHMGNQDTCNFDDGCTDPNDFGQFSPFDLPEHYHDLCVIEDYGNQLEVKSFHHTTTITTSP